MFADCCWRDKDWKVVIGIRVMNEKWDWNGVDLVWMSVAGYRDLSCMLPAH